jgi:hypothetical protein
MPALIRVFVGHGGGGEGRRPSLCATVGPYRGFGQNKTVQDPLPWSFTQTHSYRSLILVLDRGRQRGGGSLPLKRIQRDLLPTVPSRQGGQGALQRGQDQGGEGGKPRGGLVRSWGLMISELIALRKKVAEMESAGGR